MIFPTLNLKKIFSSQEQIEKPVRKKRELYHGIKRYCKGCGRRLSIKKIGEYNEITGEFVVSGYKAYCGEIGFYCARHVDLRFDSNKQFIRDAVKDDAQRESKENIKKSKKIFKILNKTKEGNDLMSHARKFLPYREDPK